MISDVIEWFKGLLGDAGEQVADGVNETLDQVGGDAGETLGEFQEVGQDLASGDYGQTLAEAAVGGATESVSDGVTEATQGFQEHAEAVGGVVEDPLGTAGEEARDRLGGEG